MKNKTFTYSAFVNSFAREKLANFYHVYGTEEYLKKKVADMIVNRAIAKEHRDFDLVIFYGNDCDVTDVLDAISSDPFLAEDKVIIVRKFDSLRGTIQQKIIDFLHDNEIFNLVILLSEKIDNRLKLAKMINKLGVTVHCRSPYKPEDMIGWLKGEVNANKKSIDSEAAVIFVNRVELDYMTAANELEKLLLFTVNTKTITSADVEVSTGNSRSYSVFDLTNAVGAKDIKKAIIVTENMLENNDAAVFIITMLLRLFVQLWKINFLKKEGIRGGEIAAKHLTDIHIMFRNDYLRFAANYSLQVIPAVFSALLEADRDLKSLDLEDKLIIERMLFRIFSLK